MTSSAANESPSGLPSVGHNLKGEPEDYMKDFAGELGNAKRAGYDEPLSVGVGKGEWLTMRTLVPGPTAEHSELHTFRAKRMRILLRAF